MSACILGETVADQQMWDYQTEKYRRKAAGEAPGPYSRGFIESGLWAYSRHPNYFCEVSTWWSFYLFSVGATGKWLNWTIWGPLFLSGLFVPPGASLDVTEKLPCQVSCLRGVPGAGEPFRAMVSQVVLSGVLPTIQAFG